MSENTKTKEQLLAEIEALEEKLAQSTEAQSAKASTTPARSGLLTRRALSAWVAPVIISLPALGTILKPGEAKAQYYATDDLPPVFSLPTATPTASPTGSPTVAPTRAGRCITPPSVAPTLGMAAAPDCGPSAMGFIALGSARALAAARV